MESRKRNERSSCSGLYLSTTGMDGYLTYPPHVAVLSLLFFEEG